MEADFADELQLLSNALRKETFRFIIVSYNRYSIYKDIADWLRLKYPARIINELRLRDKEYRQIADELQNFQSGIILIPDFDWLLLPENESICVAFNQRRDAYAVHHFALLCFVGPNSYRTIADKLPDWWSIRSLELDFHRDIPDAIPELLSMNSSLISSLTKEEKLDEIVRLEEQLASINSANKLLKMRLMSELGELYYDLSEYEKASDHFKNSLTISRELGAILEEGDLLNNLSQIYKSLGNYKAALHHLKESLAICKKIGNRYGEGVVYNNLAVLTYTFEDYELANSYLLKSLEIAKTNGDLVSQSSILNNLGQIFKIKKDYEKALKYLQESLTISKDKHLKAIESTVLNNIGQILKEKAEYSNSLKYLEEGLRIQREIGDRRGEALSLNNISQIYIETGNYEAAKMYLIESIKISEKIGSLVIIGIAKINLANLIYESYGNTEDTIEYLLQAEFIFKRINSLANLKLIAQYLSNIKAEVGEASFNKILESIRNRNPNNFQ